MNTNATTAPITSEPIAAGAVTVGMLVLVSSRMADYHGQPDMAGTVHVVTAVNAYSPSCVGITLAGLPETCALPGSSVAVVR